MQLHEQDEVPVVVACKVLGLARSTYYCTCQRLDEGALLDTITAIAGQWPTYGSRRITRELRRAPYMLTVNRKRVQRLMRELKLHAGWPRRSRQTTNSQHSYRRYPNLVRGLEVKHPDQVWVSDITYISLRDEEVYLAIIMDVFTRAIRGWNLSRTLDHQLTVGALRDALIDHLPEIHHSDQGVQYAATRYIDLLTSHGVQISMAATGCPEQNSYAERLIRTIKEEEVYLADYMDFPDAYRQIRHFIEDVYQTKRIHSALGYLTPVEFEAAWSVKPGSTSPLTMR
jgi:transposase InsO family protein